MRFVFPILWLGNCLRPQPSEQQRYTQVSPSETRVGQPVNDQTPAYEGKRAESMTYNYFKGGNDA